MKMKWPHGFPGVHYYDEREEKGVLSVLRNGAPFRYYGRKSPKFVDAFEANARTFYGMKYAHGVNSGTGGLITALHALGVGPGDEVIVPTFFWVATVGCVVNVNAIPVLCEVNDTLNMDPADLEKKITPRTKVILVVHMAGAPADMKRIMAIARKHRIAVLEDCAQCNGGSVGGKLVGTFGQVGMFSLQINKNCTTGEGGLLVTNDRDLYGRIMAAHDVGVPWKNGGCPIDTPYVMWGGGRRMSELVGAVAAAQIRKLPTIVKNMHASNRRMRQMLAGTPGLTLRRLVDEQGDTGAFLIFSVADEACALTSFQQMREAGLPAHRLADYGMHVYYNIPQLVQKLPLSPAGNPWSLPQNARSVYEYAQGACPRSDELFARTAILPVPSVLTRKQEEQAVRIIKSCVGC